MINLQVRGDRPDVLASSEHGLPWCDVLADLDRAQFPMFGHLIPYGDTIFNHRQIETLLDELPRLPAGLVTDAFAEALRELCSFAQEAPHRYLWFVGD
ncbi:hypothetical protein [Actinomadura oligospora]|uniref:hypothetical protein n=1 Tax=Actinomadura oligospora TaxID=111804 RepID=UPI00047AEE2F|nr:hypothetical protein [Actinomadura oligospora]